MNRLVIMTVGASLITNDPPIQDTNSAELQNRAVNERQSYGKMWERLVMRLRTKLEESDQKKSCAEISTLLALEVSSEDSVLLISTDTLDCYACATVISEWLKDNVRCKVADIPLFIEGLQINDQKKLRQQGLPNLVETLLKKIEDNKHSWEIILSPTGGYKGVVPYLTLIGMMFACPIYYLFEEAVELIKLPAIPIDFHLEKLSILRTKIKELDTREGEKWVVPWDKFWEGIPVSFDERDNYEPFFERSDEVVSLSALGRLMTSRETVDLGRTHEVETCDLFIKQWLDLKGEQREKVEKAIGEFSKGIDSRHYHTWGGEDRGLLYFKQDGTAFRISFREEHEKYWLCKIFFDHKEYENNKDTWQDNFKNRSWIKIR